MNSKSDINTVIANIVSLLLRSEKKGAAAEALQSVLRFYEVDWVSVASLEQNHSAIFILNGVISEWAEANSNLSSIPRLSKDSYHWINQFTSLNKVVVVNDVNDLSLEAFVERGLFRRNNIQSALFIPIYFNEAICGFLSLGSIQEKKEWTNQDIDNLCIIADLCSILVERYRKEQVVLIEKQRTDEELKKAKDADMLKSAFLANMSHEIRTPLNAIVGFSSIIAETENPIERKYYQQVVDRNNEMLLQIISDILDFSKIESGSLKFAYDDINLRDICHEVNRTYTLRPISHRVQFVFNRERHPDLILHTDGNRIMQVITNLVSNAFKFTREGSIVLSYRVIEDKVRISVSDTGMGIPPESQSVIFERFTKVNNFSQGTGLGLSICKFIIESLGGQIGLNSLPNKGSTFWFTLPLTSAGPILN